MWSEYQNINVAVAVGAQNILTFYYFWKNFSGFQTATEQTQELA